MKTTLICTVGGSHQPIVTAIETLRPDYVCFVCSQDDPATGNKGSHVQVTGKGHIIKARHADEKPTLPNIPAQVGLADGQFEVLEVSPDDFDDIYRRIIDWMTDRDAGAERLVADYTGGTKSMSAALVCAALDHGRVELQLVTGSRANLVKVESGSEIAVPASVAQTRFRRQLQQALSLWHTHAYEQSMLLLGELSPPMAERNRYFAARDLSRAFALWDRFDHSGAHAIINRYRGRLGRSLGPLLGALDLLNKEVPAREPLQIFDLFRNAERRATQGRYDDAVARLYRMLEWSAQWLLKERAGIETADIPPERIPAGLELPKNREGRYQAGLYASWQLAAEHAGSEVAQFWNAEQNRMLDLLKIRNHSILAHGFTPLAVQEWDAFHNWVTQSLLPMLLKITAHSRYRLKELPPQLPARYPGGDPAP